MGANGIETDVQITKDGILVLFHDDTLERVTGEKGSISDYTLEELNNFFVTNSKYKNKDKIVTLEDFLRLFGYRDLIFAIELKKSNISKAVIEMLNKYNMKEKVIITSFIYSELQNAAALNSGYKLGLLYTEGITHKKAIELLDNINAYQACPKAETLTKENLEYIYSHGYECRAWGIFNEDIMKNMVDIGINGGMTVNFPDKLTNYLSKKSN